MAKKAVAEVKPDRLPVPGSSLEVAEKALRDVLETASVERVFGEPIEAGDTLLIPAAEVFTGIGFGVGFGKGFDGDEEPGNTGRGEGAGGGGRTFSRPVAVVIASPEGVRIEAVRDTTKVVLAAVTAAGFMAAMVMRMISPKRAFRELKRE
jgi:uncharacterized spore protein YtfJ